jgi:hypothetical protein
MATEVIKTVKPSGGDYTSLSAWEAGEQGNLSRGGGEIAVAECYSMQDTTAVIIDGWTTYSDRYIKIYTPSSERHPGYYDTSKYRLESADTVLDIRENYVRVHGLQIKMTTTGNKGAILLTGQSSDNRIEIAYNIITAAISGGGGTGKGIWVYETTAAWTNAYIWDNIVYDIFNTTYPNSTAQEGIYNQYGTVYAYNNTVYKAAVGYRNGPYTFYSTNNLADCYAQNSNYTDFSGTFTSSDYNASTDTTAPGASSQTGIDPAYVDEDGDDFHLASSDTACRDNGASDPGSGLFSDDIDGDTRSGSWDIGADEYVTAGGQALKKTIDEAEQMSEAVARRSALRRVMDESLNISEGVLRFISTAIIKVIGEALSVSEGVLRYLGILKVIEEAVNLAETDLRRLYLRRISNEALLLSENVFRRMGVRRIISEGIELAETALRRSALVRAVNEGLSVVEAVVKTLGGAAALIVEALRRLFMKDTKPRAFTLDTRTRGFTLDNKRREFRVR